jgi:putative acetyltransferase
MLEIIRAATRDHYFEARDLMNELSAWDMAQTAQLGLDPQVVLEFYYSSVEEPLPGVFAPPEGILLLARDSGQAVGCIAFYKMADGICEMKRLYVRPEYRSKKVGRMLGEALLRAAQSAGYRVMRLETTTFMTRAVALYSSLGFTRCDPYYSIPEAFLPVTVFMQCDLANCR